MLIEAILEYLGAIGVPLCSPFRRLDIAVNSPRFRNVVWVPVVSAIIAACSSAGGPLDEHGSKELPTLERRLAKIEGRSGSIEGVYSIFNFESDSFQFCSSAECPDIAIPACLPQFTEEARRKMGALSATEDGLSIHLQVIGSVRTALRPGLERGFGPDEEMCEISITDVQSGQTMDARMVRSKAFPQLLKPYGHR
ncbi:hypothetical protein [Sphingomonas sp. 22176]|uniref:hypothetical protein n=1 Tax=Sphingomonas sp. 22176 TaxID=3453884 RepID=UPI003F83D4A9